MITALVTGGSGEIGGAICESFAKQGYNVVINYNKSKENAMKLLKKLQTEYGICAIALKADITKRDEVENMISDIKEQFGCVDILVNNAGISKIELFTDVSPCDWHKMIDTNLNGAFHCTQCVLPDMIRRHKGSVINISSMWGQTGASCEVCYSTAKAGLIGFTKALAKELAPSNIRVNCVAPGVIKTKMLDEIDESALNELVEETPIGRLGTPDDIANAVLFLTQESSSFITGQILGVNGGFVI